MAVTITEVTYSSDQVCELAGCTYRQLDYWVRIGLVRPSVAEARGSGTHRRFAAEDVAVARRVKLASDFSSGSLQDALDRLADLESELEQLKGTIDDRSARSVDDQDRQGADRLRHPSAGRRGREGLRRVASTRRGRAGRATGNGGDAHLTAL